VVSQCSLISWLNELASGDQRRLTGSSSALEACSRRCAIQTAALFHFTYLILFSIFCWSGLVVITDAIGYLERFVTEMNNYYVSSETLNLSRSLPSTNVVSALPTRYVLKVET